MPIHVLSRIALQVQVVPWDAEWLTQHPWLDTGWDSNNNHGHLGTKQDMCVLSPSGYCWYLEVSLLWFPQILCFVTMMA